jgi:hypothetical protein
MDVPSTLLSPEDSRVDALGDATLISQHSLQSSPLSSSLSDFTEDDPFFNLDHLRDREHESSPPPPPPPDNDNTRGPKRDRQSTAAKLEQILKAINEAGLSFPKFIRTWVNSEVEIDNRIYRTRVQRRKTFNIVMEELITDNVVQYKHLTETLVLAIQEELDTLIDQGEHFRQFDKVEVADCISIETMDLHAAGRTVEEFAPTWFSLIQQLLMNQRSHRATYTSSDTERTRESILNRLFTITAIACYSRSKKRSNFFPSLLGAYMRRTGTKRRVTDVVHEMGVIPAYSTISDLIDDISADC